MFGERAAADIFGEWMQNAKKERISATQSQ